MISAAAIDVGGLPPMTKRTTLEHTHVPWFVRFGSAADARLGALRRWWSAWWLRLSIIALVAIVGLLLSLWWFVGERTGSGEAVLLHFFDSLVGIASVALAGAVTIATVHSASRAARAVELTQEQQVVEHAEKKKGRVDALVGASLEVGAYGAWMAQLRRRGRKLPNRLLPEPIVQRELIVASWRQLSDAAVAASKALEQIRYEDPELFELAGHHYDLVTELQQAAFEGEPDGLEATAVEIRASADSLWSAM